MRPDSRLFQLASDFEALHARDLIVVCAGKTLDQLESDAALEWEGLPRCLWCRCSMARVAVDDQGLSRRQAPRP